VGGAVFQRPFYSWRFGCVAVGVFFCLAARGEAARTSLTFCCDDNYPPYEYASATGEATGFNVELLRAIAEVMGWHVTVRPGPWNQVRTDLEQGRIDGLTGMFYSKAREEHVTFSTSFITVMHAIFVREDSEIHSLEEIQGKEIIVQKGDIMHDYVLELGMTKYLIATENQEEALEMLASGRHDCALLGRYQGLYNIRRLRIDNLKTTGGLFSPRQYCFAVRKGDTVLEAGLNEGLSLLRGNGQYEKIYARWFGSYHQEELRREALKYTLWVLIPLLALLAAAVGWSWSLRVTVARQTRELSRELAERKQAEQARARLEAQVIQTQKLESLGVLAGGIAHDFNNLLTGVMGNSELALMELPAGSPAREQVRAVQEAARRAADLCRQLLAYSGRGRFVICLVEINDVVLETARLAQVSMSKRVELVFSLAQDMPRFEADVTQIRQVLMNLLTNSAEAIGDAAGTITVTTGARAFSQEELDAMYFSNGCPAGNYIFVRVADTGPGMDKATIERVFDPFFTTKFMGRGLGLPAASGIVRGHRGALNVQSAPGAGTTFEVLFPAGEGGVSQRVSVAVAPETWNGRGWVLLVDDEEPVRKVGRRMLERMGFSVLVAVNGQEALALYEEHARNIVAVLLDLTMPVMDGEETLRYLRALNPDVRVVVCSGYAEQETAARFEGQGLAGVLYKPYQYDELRNLMQAVTAE